MAYKVIEALKVDTALHNFIETEVLPGLSITADAFWDGLSQALAILMPINAQLLDTRLALQTKQDVWHKANPGPITDFPAYISFLEKIGYIAPKASDFKISTKGLDDEIAKIAGPQLVVPINNARYALNAANARWGSLYDALYGTNVIAPVAEISKDGFDAAHGAKVIAWGRDFLNLHFALETSSHADATAYTMTDDGLSVTLKNGKTAKLIKPEKCVGYQGDANAPSGIILKNNGLHILIEINPAHFIGKDDAANVADIRLESALSTIMDCEDSVAATNADEKIGVYRNWLGLMKSDLSVKMQKVGKTITRALNSDIEYTSLAGQNESLKGRSLMLVRNVGHLMTSDAIMFNDQEIPEGIMDAFMTALAALHNISADNKDFKNSENGSIYVVKPKMHGPEEVAFANQTFSMVENVLDLAHNTIKIGIMDEERRTSVNLKACIEAVKERVFFINTGFLDRTGDEIHTIMHAGPVIAKGDIKHSKWIAAYEARNVQIGLECGFKATAQIGKGMWAMPDEMAAMMAQKVNHLKAGATTAWVPSPTAATLHATHYHQFNVAKIQDALPKQVEPIEDLLDIPVTHNGAIDKATIEKELANNAQGILGYVVRWVEQGIGCSKVPDINNIGLMEDRATLRISSQHIANWLVHGICNEQQVLDTLKQMAAVVDGQNSGDDVYQNMAPNFDDSIAFAASCALIFEGAAQPSGYTEPLLHAKRRSMLDA